MEYSEDFKLLLKKDYFGLWKKYQRLIGSFYRKFVLNFSYEYERFEDFSYDMYEIVVNAANALDIKKIKNPETWYFYIQLYFYLNNFINRDFLRQYGVKNMYQMTDLCEKNLNKEIEDNSEKVEASLLIDMIQDKLTEKEVGMLNNFLKGTLKKKTGKKPAGYIGSEDALPQELKDKIKLIIGEII